MIKIEQIYIWLSMIDNLHYYIFIRLLKAFHGVENIYNESKDYITFIKILNQNNIILNQNLVNDLTNRNLKEKANNRYIEIQKYNINLTNIFSNEYPKSYMNMYNPPYIMYYYGDISLISNKNKIYTYSPFYLTKYSNDLYTSFTNYINNIGVNVYINKTSTINCIIIIDYEMFVENYSSLNKSNLYIIVFSSSNIRLLENTCAMSDKLLVIQARYERDICILTDIMLEQGKDILVVPGNIKNINTYFSNYLIKEGAKVVLNIYDLLDKNE